jgi:hypothetical protein
MSEAFYTTAWVVLAAFFIAGAGAVLGGLVVASMRAEGVEPADAFDGYDETTELAVVEPAAARVVANRPMSAMSVPADLETQTIRIKIGREGDAVRGDATPWWAGPTRINSEVTRDFTWGRHDPQCQPESRTARPAPRFLGDVETTEYPRLDWSGRTQEVDGVGRHPSGEYPVLDGAA